MVVEVMPKEEIVSKGGLVLSGAHDHKSTTDMHRPMLARVLAVGNGYFDEETNETESIDIPVGAVVMLSPFSLTYLSHFPGIPEFTGEVIALSKAEAAHIMWPDLETYLKYREILSA